mmetsp:Transcript_36842/g.54122  ORF Transcript_36842/g.54122 Transcript_36842/m.54122 type:complete len:94 (+) Transcript_36842:77-358(+)|eukprot:CAMPEP_0195522092 /NCGR_PEP_ID=MMETSP0794_2-20130614/20033_1 /TAXON_ID=515487 /ORGANISM="Stephanopyxis turris, Strain CCMP 815" /LENGTH=93 /DNA_ID=CAMNT_0040651779 /DNA_START=70 /DNA_END=351 /DNA_ORIENTATION=+
MGQCALLPTADQEPISKDYDTSILQNNRTNKRGPGRDVEEYSGSGSLRQLPHADEELAIMRKRMSQFYEDRYQKSVNSVVPFHKEGYVICTFS